MASKLLTKPLPIIQWHSISSRKTPAFSSHTTCLHLCFLLLCKISEICTPEHPAVTVGKPPLAQAIEVQGYKLTPSCWESGSCVLFLLLFQVSSSVAKHKTVFLFFPGWQDWPSTKCLRNSAESDVLHTAWFDGKEAYLYRRALRK